VGKKKEFCQFMKFQTRQVKGHGRGKLLGYPTINMEIPKDLAIKEGIYAVRVSIGDNAFKGALHYGPVPVFDQKTNSLEVFLLGVSSQEAEGLDTTNISIEPIKRLRDVRAFASESALVLQIQQDVRDVESSII
jgi:riboflavin kinase/FMN adenylyltransferase